MSGAQHSHRMNAAPPSPTTPLVTIVIPTWNRERSLGKAVSSALNQTLSDIEILVCDDGSTDDSRGTIAAFSDPRVQWLPGPRGGRPAIPRNRGIANARGKWLAFLDSDDAWLPGKLERQVLTAQNLEVDAVCTNAWHLGPTIDGKVLGGPIENDLIGWREALRRNPIHCSSVLVRRSLMLRTGGFPEDPGLIVGEDYAAWLRLLAFTKFAYIGEPFVDYFDDPRTTVRVHSSDGWTQHQQVLDNFLSWARDNPTELPAAMIGGARLRKAYSRFRGAIRPWLRRL